VRLVVGVAISLTLAAAAGASAAATRVTIFHPFAGGKLAPRLHVTRTLKGYCFAGSSADPRKDAWRCMSDNLILDPCFSDPKVVSWVACPELGSPFETKMIRLALSRALPKTLRNHGVPGRGNPWAVKLADGQICTFLTGATFAYYGERANYGCTAKTFLAGSPNRSGKTWTITLGTSAKAPPKTVEIAVATW
jgi:hypothetical protein